MQHNKELEALVASTIDKTGLVQQKHIVKTFLESFLILDAKPFSGALNFQRRKNRVKPLTKIPCCDKSSKCYKVYMSLHVTTSTKTLRK